MLSQLKTAEQSYRIITEGDIFENQRYRAKCLFKTDLKVKKNGPFKT